MTLAELTAHMRAATERAALAPEMAAERLAPIMVATAKETIGTMALRDLLQSTQDDREAKGYPRNEPLLREGDFRESIVGGATGNLSWCGSADRRALWFEYGTTRMRPFSLFALTRDAVMPEALAIAKAVAAETIGVLR